MAGSIELGPNIQAVLVTVKTGQVVVTLDVGKDEPNVERFDASKITHILLKADATIVSIDLDAEPPHRCGELLIDPDSLVSAAPTVALWTLGRLRVLTGWGRVWPR